MKSKVVLLILAALAVACGAAPSTDPGGDSVVEGDLDYGWWRVTFPTSESGQAQTHFLRGLTAMHLYMFEDAAAEFRRAQEISPDFAMAYWGEAMTHYRPIWREWEPEEARAILARLGPSPEARAEKTGTPRERAYLNAVEMLFAEGPPPDDTEPRESHERLRNYERSMHRLVQDFPDDPEAKALWAGARVVMFERTQRHMAERMRTTLAAQEVLESNPRHPGAARALLQSTDDPVHGSISLLGARVFMGAPETATDATAQHLPSHTMAQLGRWQEMADMNWTAFETSMEWTERRGFALSDLNNHNYGHLLNYAQYGYLQVGMRDRARAIIDQARSDFEASGHAPVIGNTLVSAIALYMIESRDWSLIDELLELRDVRGMDQNRTLQYALGLGGALSGDLPLARSALAHIPTSSTRSTIMHHQIGALIAFQEGDADTALRLLAETAEIDERQIYTHFGPANPLKPAHELYGEILLALDRPLEALEAFETSIWIFNRRASSLLGAAEAAAESGLANTADGHYQELADIWKNADADVRTPLMNWEGGT